MARWVAGMLAAVAAMLTATAWGAGGAVEPGNNSELRPGTLVTAPCADIDEDTFGFPGGSPENGDTWYHETRTAQILIDRGVRGWVPVDEIYPPSCEPVEVSEPGKYQLIKRTQYKREEYQNGWQTLEDEEETVGVLFEVTKGRTPTICTKVAGVHRPDGTAVPATDWGDYGLKGDGIGAGGVVRSGSEGVRLTFRDSSRIALEPGASIAAPAGCKAEPDEPHDFLRRLRIKAGEIWFGVPPDGRSESGERTGFQARMMGGDTINSRVTDIEYGRSAPRARPAAAEEVGAALVVMVRVAKSGGSKLFVHTGRALARGRTGPSRVVKAGKAVATKVGGGLKAISMAAKPPKWLFD